MDRRAFLASSLADSTLSFASAGDLLAQTGSTADTSTLSTWTCVVTIWRVDRA